MVTEAQKGLRNLWNLAGCSKSEKARKRGGEGVQKRKRRKCPQGRDLEGIAGFRNQKLDTY